MRFLIDENIRREVIDFLKSAGHDILVVTRGLEDEKIAQMAKKTKRIILTHDYHFANILIYPPEVYSGIIRIKIHPPTATVIINALGSLLQKLTCGQIQNKLIILEEDGFRIR